MSDDKEINLDDVGWLGEGPDGYLLIPGTIDEILEFAADSGDDDARRLVERRKQEKEH